MQNKNTMNKKEFLGDAVLFGLLGMLWFRNTLFRLLPGKTYDESRLTLWILVAVCILIGTLVCLKSRRNYLSTFINVIIPYELYALVTFQDTYSQDYQWLFPLVGVISLGFLVLMLHKGKGKKRFWGFVRHGLLGARTLAALGIFIAGLPLLINGLLGNPLMKAYEMPAQHSKVKVTVTDHLDILSGLQEEVWETLDTQQRLEVLQVAANVEASYLGLPHELPVGVGTMGQNTVGYYDDMTQTMFVNIDWLETAPAWEMLDTVCHEAYHAYQFSLCDAWKSLDPYYRELMAFNNVPTYLDNFANYINGEENYDDYYNLACEQTARQYAEEAVTDYYDILERHLKDN